MDFTSFLSQYQKVPVETYSSNVNQNPKVSVCVQTYQHSKFIHECLDGILKQITDFPIEILLGEDESTDGTREICIEYANKYPDKIRLFLHSRENNIKIGGSPTGRFNVLYNLFSANGKYIALCEGDDYWTDPYKLQKQVDFLEANDDYAICFHRVYELEEDGEKKLSHLNTSISEETYTIEDLAKGNFLHTPSGMFRNGLISDYPEWFNKSPVGDYVLHMLNAQYGKIKYLPLPMAVYRTGNGTWSSQSFESRERKLVQVAEYLMEHFNDPTVIKILAVQIVRLFSSLDSSFDPLFKEKKYAVYKVLLNRLLEKDREITELKKALLVREKHDIKRKINADFKTKLFRILSLPARILNNSRILK